MSLEKMECGVNYTTELLRTNVNELIEASVKFDNVADMKASIYLFEGDVVSTSGYHVKGDDGFASYKISDAVNVPAHILVDGFGNHTLANGKVAVLISKQAGYLCVEQYGAKGDVVDGVGTNDILPIRAALAQAKSNASLQTSVEWETITGGVVKLGSKNYGLLATQADKDNGFVCALPVSARTGLVGAGRNATMLTCLDGFGELPVVANENHVAAGFDDFMTIGGFQILGRNYHGVDCIPSHGLRINVGFEGYQRTDNYSRIFDILISNVEGIGAYGSGRGEQIWRDVQANNCNKGLWFKNLVDSHIVNCNAGGNRTVGIECEKTASSKFTNCKAYYNGSNGTNYRESCNWHIHGDSWVSGRSTFSQCESQESHGAGFVILNGGNLFSNCISADPKRSTIGAANPRPDHSVCWYLGASTDWVQAGAKDNHFENCHATPNLTTNFADLNKPSYLGDGAVYLGNGATGNTGSITVSPRIYCDDAIISGNAMYENPLLTFMGETLTDPKPPSDNVIFYENRINGVKVYGNPTEPRTNKVVGHKTSVDGSDPIFTDLDVSRVIGGLIAGTTYTFDTRSFNYLADSSVDSQAVLRQNTRTAARLDGTNGFSCDKKLIDLDDTIVKFSFSVGDRGEVTPGVLQTVFYQEGDDGLEMSLILYKTNNYRLNIGGTTIDGGSGVLMENATFDVVIYPKGLYVYNEGTLVSSDPNFTRGSARGGTNTRTYFANGSASHAAEPTFGPNGLIGQLLDFKSPYATVIFNNDSGNQQVVEGDLSTVVTEYSDFSTAWETVPLVI